MARNARRQIEGTEAFIQEVIEEENAAQGYPKKGTNVGLGPHAAVPDSWDGTGPTPPGWTKVWAKPEEHPTDRGRFSCPIRDGAHRRRLRGRVMQGRTIQDTDFKARHRSWTPVVLERDLN